METYTTVIDFRRLICISPSAARSFVSPDSISILVGEIVGQEISGQRETQLFLTLSKG
jgi:hypothetical protein